MNDLFSSTRLSHLSRSFRLATGATLLALFSLGSAHAGPVLSENVFGGPGPVSPQDALFNSETGGTANESFGLEGLARLSGQQIRFNALTGSPPGTFTFSVAKNTTFVWENGREYNFTETYSGDGTKQLSATFVDTVTNTSFSIPTYTTSFGGVEALAIRLTTSGQPALTTSSVEFKNLKLDSTSFPNVLSVSGTDTTRVGNYYAIHDFDFTNPWTLTGTVKLSWTGGTPNSGSSFGFQIKAINNDPFTTAVPEPGSWILGSLGVMGLGLTSLLRRRR